MYGKGGDEGKSALLNAVAYTSQQQSCCLPRLALPLPTLVPTTFQIIQNCKTNLIQLLGKSPQYKELNESLSVFDIVNKCAFVYRL